MSSEISSHVIRMSAKEVVAKLQTEAKANACFNAVCHIFALRERARQQVTLVRLRAIMTKEKFDFSKDEYQKVLKFMANVGLGRLVHDTKGEVVALKDIKTTLQSIGKAAINKSDKLETFSAPTTFVDLPHEKRAAATPVPKVQDAPPPKQQEAPLHPIALTVNLDGTPISFPLSRGVTVEELGTILSQLYNKPRNRDV